MPSVGTRYVPAAWVLPRSLDVSIGRECRLAQIVIAHAGPIVADPPRAGLHRFGRVVGEFGDAGDFGGVQTAAADPEFSAAFRFS